jgi:hypothetical protein
MTEPNPQTGRRWYLVLGNKGEFTGRIRKAWGIMWRGGFVGILLTEREKEK